MHIRVHPVIGQDDADVDAVRAKVTAEAVLVGTAKDTWGCIVAVSGAEIEVPLDVLATLRDRARRVLTELDASGRLAWETAFIDDTFA